MSTDSTPAHRPVGARGAAVPASAEVAGNAGASSAGAQRQHATCLVDLVQRKCRDERLETDSSYSAAELAYRRGWNASREALGRDVALAVGLAELAACDVDGGVR